MKNQLTAFQQDRFQDLRHKIKNGLKTAFEIGAALAEIKHDKLYRVEFKTFEEFCKAEYDIARRTAYQWIEAAMVRKDLGNVRHGAQINERQARVLASIPKGKREEVLSKAQSNGHITAASIEEAFSEVKAIENGQHDSKEKTHIELDKTGYNIPHSILKNWLRAEEVAKLALSKISDVKCVIEKGVEDKDVIFSEINQLTVSEIKGLFTSLKQLRPYAVCTVCEGIDAKKSCLCKGRGFISEFLYRQCATSEAKAKRENK